MGLPLLLDFFILAGAACTKASGPEADTIRTAYLASITRARLTDVALRQKVDSSPDCSSPTAWAPTMAFVHLKNAGLTDNSRLDFSKTTTKRLASERVGDGLWRQVHRVTFTEKTGSTVEVITVNDASVEECSMTGIEVYVVSQRLGEAVK
jgi:hypothetical protein